MELGARLRAARLGAQLSQRALGRKVGVTHAAISKYERGGDMPSSGVLDRLSQALGVTVDYFFRTTEVRVKPRAHRYGTRVGQKKKRAVIAAVQETLERYFDAELLCPAYVGAGNTPEAPRPWPVSSLDEVEEGASHLRQEWHLGEDPIPNMTALLEDHGIRVVEVEDLGEEFEAQLLWANDTAPVMAVRENATSGDRRRFSLAHELGHLVLAVSGGLDEEKAANRFAGSFLVPRAVAKRALGERRRTLALPELLILKQTYGLSMKAWVYRAMDLQVISRSVAGRLFRLIQAMGYERKEPGDRYKEPGDPLPESPTRLERIVMRAYAEEAVTASRAAELLRISLEDFRKRLKETADESAGGGGD